MITQFIMMRLSHNVIHIGFTSGTTGLPKAFYRNEHSWIVSFKENEKLLQHCEETIVAPGPLSHSLSLYACIYALSTGKTFIGQKILIHYLLCVLLIN